MYDKCCKLCHPNFSFLFLLAVSWFLLVVFQHFWSSKNFAFLCLITFANLLSNFKCFLGVMRKLGSFGFHYRLLQTLSQIIILLFLWKRTFIFFHTRFMSFYFYEIWVKTNVIYSYLQWKYLKTPGCSWRHLLAWWPKLPHQDKIASFLFYQPSRHNILIFGYIFFVK